MVLTNLNSPLLLFNLLTSSSVSVRSGSQSSTEDRNTERKNYKILFAGEPNQPIETHLLVYLSFSWRTTKEYSSLGFSGLMFVKMNLTPIIRIGDLETLVLVK